jgi:hypothetical protein
VRATLIGRELEDRPSLTRLTLMVLPGDRHDCTQASGDPIATFLITVSEFVRNGRKQSIIL